MKLNDIKKLIQQGESETLEFKKSTQQLKPAMETLCAFLNNRGGTVLIGVNNNGDIIGQEVTDNTRQEIANEINKVEPSAQIEVNYLPIAAGSDKLVIIMRVPVGPHAPYIYDGRPYHRNQSTTSRLSQHHYEQLLVKRGQLNYTWEETLVPDYSFDRLDPDEIQRMVADSVKANRMPIQALTEQVPQILKRLQLIQGNKVKRAAVVLFSKEEFLELPQCMIKMARFTGINKLGDFIDNQFIHGNVFRLLREADIFLRRHLPIASVFKPDQFKRLDKPALPVLAVREALINALCHADYSNRSAAISLAIYDDRLEIWNAGNLPHQITVEDLKHTHESLPRNKLIAEVFYQREFIETWGTGTNKMVTLCKEEGLPEPEFELRSGGLAVTFKFKEVIGKVIREEHDDSSLVKEADLTPRQHEIMTVLASGIALSAAMIGQQLNQPPAARTLRDDLVALKKLGLIDSRGRGSNAVWYKLNKENR